MKVSATISLPAGLALGSAPCGGESTPEKAESPAQLQRRASIGVLIRFKNSEATLPAVLAALKEQSIQPDVIVGVDSGSTDGSLDLLLSAGASIVRWTGAYHHAKVLNFGVARCVADYVLVLSSHTVLEDREILARMVAALELEDTACVSGKWEETDGWSDAITWRELCEKGLRFCSIYSNSFGMFRRVLWEATPFDERLVTMEDYAWALQQVQDGNVCRRLLFRFRYQRAQRDRNYAFAAISFYLARRHGLRVAWLGVTESLKGGVLAAIGGGPDFRTLRLHRDRLLGWLFGRYLLPGNEH